MTETTEWTEEERVDNWKTKTLIAGTVIGAVLGLLSAYLMVRTTEESELERPQLSTSDALKVGIAAIGLVRGIAALGK